MEVIVEVLTEVTNWKMLAGSLDVEYGKISGIKANCLIEMDTYRCCRRELVRMYCDKTGKNTVDVVKEIARILERSMALKSQADKLRLINFGKLSSNKYCY